MQTTAKRSRFLIKSPSLKLSTDLLIASKQGEFYQLFTQGLIRGVHTKQVLTDLGNKLVAFAEYAYQIRQMETLEQVSNILLGIPLDREYESIGYYYQALCIKRQGQVIEARALFERVAEKAPLRYKARAMQSLGITFVQSNDFQVALPLFTEVGKVLKHCGVIDPLIAIPTQQAIAVLKSIDGDHRGAFAYLKNMLPLFHSAGPVYLPMYYAYLNSLAVEMAELGQLEEARYLSNIVLASPYAFAYPEWRETSDDIDRKAYRSPRSFVPLNYRPLDIKNVLYLSVREPGGITDSEKHHCNPFQQGSITSLQDWKRKMVKEPNDKQSDKEDLKNATEKDLYLKLMELMAKRDLLTKQLRWVIDFVERISSEPDSDPKAD